MSIKPSKDPGSHRDIQWMNDLTKKVINRGTYSLEEVPTGDTWLGSPIYRKVVDVGALPNTTTKSVSHNISDLDFMTDLRVVAVSTGTVFYRVGPIPSLDVYLKDSDDKVYINTTSDLSAYSGYAIIEYTKA